MLGGSRTRAAIRGIRRLPNFRWSPSLAASASSAIRANLRGYSQTNDEFWVVEGEVLRIKSNPDPRLFKVIEKGPPPQNLNLSKKMVARTRLQRVLANRLTPSEKAQEAYWKTYTARFQHVQEQWEKIYWDGAPKEAPVVRKVDYNDPFSVLGLERREKPFSPTELKSAYREMALKYHPDHNPGKDAEARFEKIWNAYKMLQHRRSWR